MFYRMLKSISVLALTMLLIACTLQPSWAQDQPFGAEVIGGDEAGVRELLARILSPVFFAGDARIRVFVGTMPDSFAVQFPLPADARLIGSTSSEGGQPLVQLYFDTAQAADAVLDFYRANLNPDSWRAVEVPEQSGLLTQNAPVFAKFCGSGRGNDAGSILNLLMRTNAAGITYVNAIYQVELNDVECGEAGSSTGSAGMPLVSNVIPALSPPQGSIARDRGTGGAGGSAGDVMLDYSFYSVIELQTDLAPAQVAAHYNDQLQIGGWVLLNESSTDLASTSTWAYTDSDGNRWTGIFTASVIAAGQQLVTIYAVTDG